MPNAYHEIPFPSVRRGAAAAIAAACLTLMPTTARAGCSTTICVGNSTACTISGTNNVDDNCLLDFGTKQVTIVKNAKLQTASNGASFAVNAGQLTVQGLLQAQGGTLTATTSSGFKTEVVNSSLGKVDVRNGGTILIVAQGAVELLGQDVNADGATGGDGGTIWAIGSSITTTSPVHADGNAGGAGGYIALQASGDISIGGLTTVDAEGPVNGNLSVSGGTISIRAGGALGITKNLLAKGDQDGDGGVIELVAGGTATLGGNYSVAGVGSNGGAAGGSLTLEAGSASISGTWTATGNGGGQGGIVVVQARTGTLTTASTSSFDVSSGAFGSASAGSARFEASGDLSAGGSVTADSGGLGSYGGSIDVRSDGNLTISQTLEAKSTTNNGGHDGNIYVSGCAVTISGALKTRNQPGGGTNTIEYLTSLTATGSLLADDGDDGNTITCRCVDANADGVCDSPASCVSSPSLSGATVTPSSPTILPEAAAACS